MKHLKIYLIAFLVTACQGVFAQYISMNTSGTAGSSQAILDLSNNPNLGLLIPNVSLNNITDVTTIPSPADGLLVYNTNASITSGFGVGYYYYSVAGSQWYYMQNSGTAITGAVTSVGLSLPSVFNVTGSPITSSGTFGVTLANENANTILAGPVSGPAASPTFRALVAGDIPSGIPNTSLAHSSITVVGAGGVTVTGSPVSLGGAITINGPAGTVTSVGPGAEGGANTGGSGLTYSPASITGAGTIGLAASGVTAGNYGTSSQIPIITVNAEGQITNVTNTAVTNSGTVTSIGATTAGAQAGTSGLTFSANPLTSTGNLAIATGGITNAMLVNSSLSVLAGNGLVITAGANPLSLGSGTVTLGISAPVSIANGGTGTITAPTQYGVIYAASGTQYASTAAGTSGYVLTGNGASAPTFQALTATVGNGYIINQTTLQPTANFNIQSAAAGSVGGVIEGASGQTADLLDFDNSTGTPLAYFNSAGNLTTQALTAAGAVNMNIAGGATTNIGTGTGLVVIGNSTGKVGVGTTTPVNLFNVNGITGIGQSSATTGANTGSLNLYNAGNTGSITIQAGSLVSGNSYSMTLPLAQGAANTVLTDNGSGVLSWTSPLGLYTANNGLTYASPTLQLGGALVQGTTVNASAANYTMAFDLGTGSIAGTGTFNVNNGGATAPYLYVAKSTQGASVGIGNSAPGANLLNVSTPTVSAGTGNRINLAAQEGAAGSQGGNTSISGGTAGTNAAGGAVTIAAGTSAGNANGANVIVQAGAASGTSTTSGGVAINNTGATPDPSALVDMASTTSGLLIPRMTTAQMNAINPSATTAIGLMVYATDTYCYMYWTGAAWAPISCACSGAPGTPTAFTGTNNTNPCGGSTNTYSIAATAGATSYYWIIPAGGGTILSGQGTLTVTVMFGNTPTTSISVFALNSCGSSNRLTESITINQVPGNPTYSSGPSTLCAPAASQTYSFTAASNATSYGWKVTPNSNVTWTATTVTNTNSISWSAGANATYVIRDSGINACGTSLSPATYTVIVSNTLPGNPTAVSGPTTDCDGSGAQTYTCSQPSGAASYLWSVASTNSTSTGVTLGASVTYTNTVNWTTAPAGVYTVTVYAHNLCGTSVAAATWTVNISTAIPTNPTVVSGSTTICPGAGAQTYTCSQPSGTLSYVWSLSSTNSTTTGVTFGSSTTFTNSITWSNTAAAGVYTVTVYATNTCGNSVSPATWTVTVSPLPGNPSVVSGNTIVCATSGAQTYTCTQPANTTSYIWSLSSTNSTTTGITLGVSTSYTNTLNWTTSAAAGIYTVTVYANNSCGNSLTSATWTVAVAISTPTTPTSVSGATSVCATSGVQTYTCSQPTGATSYTWSLNSTNSTTTGITLGVSTTYTNTVNWTTSAAPGTYSVSVTASNSCGASAAYTWVVSVADATIPNNVITGPQGICPASTPTFTCTATNAATYSWSVTGAIGTISGSSTSSTMTLTPAALANNSAPVNGTITCVASNACNTVSTTYTVVLYPLHNTGYTYAYTGGYQYFYVPTCVTSVTITANGASGGSYTTTKHGGYGASMTGTFAVSSGQVLSMLVGQYPGLIGTYTFPGGGGGTFVGLGANYATATPLIVGGGGGGTYNAAFSAATSNATTTVTGDGPNPGTGGNGAPSVSCGGGGGGFLTSGGNDVLYVYPGGAGFRQGGAGGAPGGSYQPGGFGGGAAADYVGSCNTEAGAGGGYNGGSGTPNGNTITNGCGAGSYNGGTAQTNAVLAALGNGSILMVW